MSRKLLCVAFYLQLISGSFLSGDRSEHESGANNETRGEWGGALLERYSQGPRLNVSQFVPLYAAYFPVLAGVTDPGHSADDGHGHRRKLRMTRRRFRRSFKKAEADEGLGEEEHEEEHNETANPFCFSAAEVVAEADSDGSGDLDRSEMEGAMVVLMQMLVDGCHSAERVAMTPGCIFTESTSGEAWGYSMLSGVLITAVSVVLTVLAFVLSKRHVAEAWLTDAAIAVGTGAGLGACLLIFFPFVTRVQSTLSLFDLSGASSDSGHELDFLWPLIVAVAVVMIAQVTHQMLARESGKRTALPLEVQTHVSLTEWVKDEESKTTTPADTVTSTSAPVENSRPDSAAVLTVCAVAVTRLGFGLLVGATWGTTPRLGLMMSAAFAIALFLLDVGAVAVVSSLPRYCGPMLVAMAAGGAGCLFVGIVVGVALPSAAASAARYELALPLALWLYVASVFMTPRLVRVSGLLLSIAVGVAAIVAFGIVMTVVTAGPAAAALPLC